MLKEGDLRDLQERYKTTQITLATQNELLEKLSDRLASAAQYFHLISQEEIAEKEKIVGNASAKLEQKDVTQEESKQEKPARRGLGRFFGFK
jgi:deoxyribodipyrimidine photolyase